METKYQTKKFVLSRLIFCLTFILLLCQDITADWPEPEGYLHPNPNYDYGCVDVDETIEHSTIFQNWYEGEFINNGTINISPIGDILNWGWMLNSWAINNSGYIENRDEFGNLGTIDNSGVFRNLEGLMRNDGSIENSGLIVNNSEANIYNNGWIANKGEIENWGEIGNWDYIYNEGTIDNNYHILNSGLIENEGLIESGGTWKNEGVLNNPGTFNHSGYMDNWDFIYNEGTIEIDELGAIYLFAGPIYNSGTIENWGYIYIWDEIYNSDTFYNMGTIDNDGYIHNSGTWFNLGTLNNNGIFKSKGTVVGTLYIETGTIAPGSSAGTMLVDGDFALSGTGTLEIEIGGFEGEDSDLLDVTGTASLTGGTIHLLFIAGYNIATDVGPGESKIVKILRAGNISDFAPTITYDFLGTPPDFVYEVYRQGNSLVFKATNTNGYDSDVLYSVIRDSSCTIQFEDARNSEGNDDSLGEDGIIEVDYFTVTVENACEDLNVYVKAGRNKIGPDTISGESGIDVVGGFWIDWTREGTGGNYTYYFMVGSDDSVETEALSNILFDFCVNDCSDAEVISPAEGEYSVDREMD